MRRIIRGVPKKILEYVIQLFSPTMDDYLYVMDLKEDYYMISPQAMERFLLPADHFYHAKKCMSSLCIQMIFQRCGPIWN